MKERNYAWYTMNGEEVIITNNERQPRSKERGPGKAGTHRISFSVSCQPDEREAIKQIARDKGVSISELVLKSILSK